LRRVAKIGITALVMILVFSFLTFTVLTYQIGTGIISNPRYCSACHIMEPFVQDWEISVHGQSFVECHLCHESGPQSVIMVGRYVLGIYEVPVLINFTNPQISAICEECHLRNSLHEVKAHSEIACRQCHGMHGPGIEVPTVDVCIHCHEDLPEYMMDTNCYKCHPREDWGSPIGHLPDEYGNLNFAECDRCHVITYLHTETPHSKIDCDLCHTEGGFEKIKPRVDVCINCHEEWAERFGENCYECHYRQEWGGRRVS